MFSRIRSHFGTAGLVVAVVALVASLAGGAIAANGGGGATASKAPRGPRGPRGPQGLTGLTGPQGLAGPQGAAGTPGSEGKQGPEGKEGKEGKAGKDATFDGGPLKSGVTETGAYSVHILSSGTYEYVTVSFPIPLKAGLEAPAEDIHYMPIGEEPTSECPGSAAEPEAEEGQLCFYGTLYDQEISFTSGVGEIFDPVKKQYVTPATGASALFTATGDGARSLGTWAVTAP